MKVTEVSERVARRETDFLTLLPPVGGGISLSLSFTASKKEERRRKGGGWGGEKREDLWNGPERERSSQLTSRRSDPSDRGEVLLRDWTGSLTRSDERTNELKLLNDLTQIPKYRSDSHVLCGFFKQIGLKDPLFIFAFFFFNTLFNS